MFDQKTLKILTKNKFKVFRLDVAPSLDMYVENSEIFKSMEKKKYNIRKVGKYSLINVGLLGQKNDIVVDDLYNPNVVYGICDGYGNFLTPRTKQKNSINKTLQKFLGKNNLLK